MPILRVTDVYKVGECPCGDNVIEHAHSFPSKNDSFTGTMQKGIKAGKSSMDSFVYFLCLTVTFAL